MNGITKCLDENWLVERYFRSQFIFSLKTGANATLSFYQNDKEPQRKKKIEREKERGTEKKVEFEVSRTSYPFAM